MEPQRQDFSDSTSGPLGVHSRCVVEPTVLIGSAPVQWPLKSLRLEQRVFDHHRLTLDFATDIESAAPLADRKTDEFEDCIGKTVSLKIGPRDEYVDSKETLQFLGIITNVTISNSGSSINRVSMEAMSPTILSDRSSGYCFFQTMTFEDVIRTVLGKYSAISSGTIKISSKFQRDFWAKWGLTDWEYITSGHLTSPSWVFYDGTKLIVDEKSSRESHDLVWQKNVGAADIRMNVRPFKHRNYSWDEQKKQTETDSEQSSATQFTGLAKKAYDSSSSLMAGITTEFLPGRNSTQASQTTQSTKGRQAEDFEGMVQCLLQTNMPSLKVGDTVKLTNLGKAYSGVYVITAIEHHIDNHTDYYNFVTSSPLQSASPAGGNAAAQTVPLPAIVTDNNDPELRGRVKVKFPMKGENGNDLESPWVRVISSYAGKTRGVYFVPEIGDEVLVDFEAGSPDNPVVLGSLWNGVEKPPAAINPGGNDGEVAKNDIKMIYSRSGHQIVLDDKDGQGKIKIIDRTGKNTMIIDSNKNTIDITADKDYNLTVKGNITLKADGDFKLEAQNVTIDGKMSCKIKAGSGGAEITSSAMMKLDATAKMEIGGAMIDINGKGPVNVKGNPISLN